MPKSPKVDTFLKKKKHPLTKEIEMVRKIILAASPKVEEDIKWSSPTFMHKGNIASFFMNTKKQVSLVFHYGASLNDPRRFLRGQGKTARVARFEDAQDVTKKKRVLQALVKEWIKLKDAE